MHQPSSPHPRRIPRCGSWCKSRGCRRNRIRHIHGCAGPCCARRGSSGVAVRVPLRHSSTCDPLAAAAFWAASFLASSAAFAAASAAFASAAALPGARPSPWRCILLRFLRDELLLDCSHVLLLLDGRLLGTRRPRAAPRPALPRRLRVEHGIEGVLDANLFLGRPVAQRRGKLVKDTLQLRGRHAAVCDWRGSRRWRRRRPAWPCSSMSCPPAPPPPWS